MRDSCAVHLSLMRLAPGLQRHPRRFGNPGSWLGGPFSPGLAVHLEVPVIPRRKLLSTLLLGVMTVSLIGCNSDSTSPTSPIDDAPPQAPSNLRSSRDAAIQRDWLEWDASASAGVASYVVHVSSTPSGNGAPVATVDASNTNYLLALVGEATTEYYRVRAIGANHVPSAFSAPVTINRAPWTGLAPPAGSDPSTVDPF